MVPSIYGVYWVKKRGTDSLRRVDGGGVHDQVHFIANEFVPTQDPSVLGFRIMSVSSGHCESQNQCQSWQCKQGRPFQGTLTFVAL